MKNGFESSNLEGSQIWVGDSMCAQLGPKLPENEFLTVQCKDQAEENVFAQNYKVQSNEVYGGNLRIKAAKPGVLVICDIEVTIKTVDLEIEKLIDEKLSQCKGWQNACRQLFPSDLEYENK